MERIRAEESCPHVQALLIARQGRLVTDEYFHGWGPNLLHTLQSVTKSFTSALVGIALARGEFRGIDEPVLDFFPDGNKCAALSERKASLRLRDLFTLRTELGARPADMRACFFHISRLTEEFGIKRVGEPHVKHLRGPL